MKAAFGRSVLHTQHSHHQIPLLLTSRDNSNTGGSKLRGTKGLFRGSFLVCKLQDQWLNRRRQVNKPRSLTRKRRNPQSRRLAVLLLLLLLLLLLVVQEGEYPNRLDPQNPVYAEETSPSVIVNGFSERLRASHIQRIRPNSENLFIYVMDYIDRFAYVEPALHLWDEAYLIIMDNFSNVFLDSGSLSSAGYEHPPRRPGQPRKAGTWGQGRKRSRQRAQGQFAPCLKFSYPKIAKAQGQTHIKLKVHTNS
ncbi:hypothetical protein U0070_021921 [Myodes glareolus]|uniref:Uncharacterized protein n=1 Tax=Myodes glareolus TaxID=447135 RepID=A0AAW0IFR6_MYOGA